MDETLYKKWVLEHLNQQTVLLTMILSTVAEQSGNSFLKEAAIEMFKSTESLNKKTDDFLGDDHIN